MKDKKFDAVRMMREIRDKLSKRYTEDSEAEKRDLLDIRKKYGKEMKHYPECLTSIEDVNLKEAIQSILADEMKV